MSFLGRLQFEICLGLVSPNWMHFLSLQCHFCLIYWAKKQDIIALMTFYLFKSLLNNWVSSLRLRGLRNTRWKTLCVHTKLVTNYRYDTTMAQDEIQHLKILNTYTTITFLNFTSLESSTAKNILRHIKRKVLPL